MRPIKIRHYGDLAVGAAMFGLCVGAGAWLSRSGEYTALIVFAAVGLVFLMYFLYTGTKTEIFSPEGILIKSLFHTRKIPWQKVEKAGIACLKLGPRAGGGHYVSVTVTGEEKGLLLQFREEIKTAIETFYGPLDFGQRMDTGG